MNLKYKGTKKVISKPIESGIGGFLFKIEGIDQEQMLIWIDDIGFRLFDMKSLVFSSKTDSKYFSIPICQLKNDKLELILNEFYKVNEYGPMFKYVL